MKNRSLKFLSLFVALFGMSFAGKAQIYVTVHPVAPIFVRPTQPSHAHVWINDEWEPEGKSYRYSGHHWDAPPHEGDRYNNGHWRHHGHDGDVWVHGSWVKEKQEEKEKENKTVMAL